jgi:CheY-like chemotaxis protein
MDQLINSGVDNKNTPIVLVVDDTPENIDVLSGGFLKLGYKIKAALNGEKALQIARKRSPARYNLAGYHDAKNRRL